LKLLNLNLNLNFLI